MFSIHARRFLWLFLPVLTVLFLSSSQVFAATFVIEGTLEGETNPFDDYLFTLTTGQTITVDMVCDPATPLDPALQILNSSGTVLVSDDDGGIVACQQSRSSRIVFTAPSAGTYTVRASSYEMVFDNDPIDVNADGDYTLTVDGVSGPPLGSIVYYGMLEGETNPFDDYAVTLAAGQTITVDMVCDPTTPLDPALQILNSGGTVLVQDDDGGTVNCTQSRSSRIIFSAPSAGTYTVRASSYEIVFDNDPIDVNADGDYILTISGLAVTAPAITSVTGVSISADAPFNHTFTATGDPAPLITYANETLPPGVTRSGDTLSGIPTVPGSYSIDVTAANGVAPDAVQTFTITVNGIAPTITSTGSASIPADAPFSHTFTATGNPTPVITYANENLPPGVTRTGDTLSGTPTVPGSYSIDVTAANGVAPDAVQTFTITVTAVPPTIISAAAVSTAADAPFSHTFTVTGNPAPVITYTNENLPLGVTRTGDTLSGTPTVPGNYSIDVTAANGVAPDALQTFTITVNGYAPVITSAGSASIPADAPFSHTFSATGNPAPVITYASENLPPGVTRTGDMLSGTPTVPGNYSIDVTAANGVAPDAVQTFTITVNGYAPVITSAGSASVPVDTPFSHTFSATGNPAPVITYTNETLPPGVTRSGDTLSGIPTVPGNYSIDVSAANGVAPDAVQTFTITVNGFTPVITSAPVINVLEGATFSHTFTVTGSPAPVITYANENLPPGVTRTGDTLSGTPTVPGNYSIDVTAANGVAPDAVQFFVLIVGGLPEPPPLPFAEDVNFFETSVVRTGVPDRLVDTILVRILYQNGRPTQWLGMDLYHAGSIGIQGVLDLGVQQAVDLTSANGTTYFEGGAVFCLQGQGALIWMSAANSPRIAEIIGQYAVPEFPGHACATLFEPGTLVLVNRAP